MATILSALAIRTQALEAIRGLIEAVTVRVSASEITLELEGAP
jgi:hypothetical protein